MAAARTPGSATSDCREEIYGAADTAMAPSRALTHEHFIKCIPIGIQNVESLLSKVPEMAGGNCCSH